MNMVMVVHKTVSEARVQKWQEPIEIWPALNSYTPPPHFQAPSPLWPPHDCSLGMVHAYIVLYCIVVWCTALCGKETDPDRYNLWSGEEDQQVEVRHGNQELIGTEPLHVLNQSTKILQQTNNPPRLPWSKIVHTQKMSSHNLGFAFVLYVLCFRIWLHYESWHSETLATCSNLFFQSMNLVKKKTFLISLTPPTPESRKQQAPDPSKTIRSKSHIYTFFK